MAEIRYIERDDVKFPKKLRKHIKNCKGIYYQGDISLADNPSIGIVGSRICTSYGKVISKEIAKRAAYYGVTVVSGLAKGVDSFSHGGALECGGNTIGIVGNGLDIYYPHSNLKLQKRMADENLLISEYPEGTPPNCWNFPNRNRLISGMSDAVVVVEAGVRSGSLITAECAVEQGKEVYAVPGNITSQNSLGTNKLIRDGARPLIQIDEIFFDLMRRGIISHAEKDIFEEKSIENLSESEKKIFSCAYERGEISIDELSRVVEISINELNGLISVLEIKGMIICEMGKVMIAKSPQFM